MKFADKLKGAGVGLAVLGIVGALVFGMVQKKLKERYRSKLSEGEAKELTFKKQIHEANLKSLADIELAERTNTLFFPKGSLVSMDVFGLTRQQNINCDSCLKFQSEYEPTLAKAINLKLQAIEDAEKARRGKGIWRGIAIGAGGLAAGLIIERAL